MCRGGSVRGLGQLLCVHLSHMSDTAPHPRVNGALSFSFYCFYFFLTQSSDISDLEGKALGGTRVRPQGHGHRGHSGQPRCPSPRRTMEGPCPLMTSVPRMEDPGLWDTWGMFNPLEQVRSLFVGEWVRTRPCCFLGRSSR